jgi:hypothetical protein
MDKIMTQCDNARCGQLRQPPTNGWVMASVRVRDGKLRLEIEHYNSKRSRGLYTYCGLPCLQQAMGLMMEDERLGLVASPK